MQRKVLSVILWNYGKNLRVLLLKMAESRGGHWQSVTGGVNEGEDFPAAAAREAKEETGLTFPTPPVYLGMEYEFKGRFGPAKEQAFALRRLGSGKPPAPTLSSEHSEFAWLPLEEAIARAHFPMNQEAIRRAALLPPPLEIDGSGRLLQEGEEITHARTRELLLAHLTQRPDGSYVIDLGKECLEVELKDPGGAARFVRAVDLGSGECILVDGGRVALPWETLYVSPKDGALYGTLEKGEKLKFLRAAYYALSPLLEETENGFALRWQGKLYSIR